MTRNVDTQTAAEFDSPFECFHKVRIQACHSEETEQKLYPDFATMMPKM